MPQHSSRISSQSFTLDGHTYEYFLNGTKFLVQVGRGSKGSYKTRYGQVTPSAAVHYFNSINIGNGYKKRLVMVHPDNKRVILAKAAS